MNSLWHLYGEDFRIKNQNIDLVFSSEQTRQNILRRLLTNQGDYIWNMKYGAGLSKIVGDVATPEIYTAYIRKQIENDNGIDNKYPVNVDIVNSGNNKYICNIEYVDISNGNQQKINFSF